MRPPSALGCRSTAPQAFTPLFGRFSYEAGSRMRIGTTTGYVRVGRPLGEATVAVSKSLRVSQTAWASPRETRMDDSSRTPPPADSDAGVTTRVLDHL